MIAGVGQGLSFRAGLTGVNAAAPPEERGEVASSFFVVAYVAISVPVIGVGLLAEATTLRTAGLVFAAVVAGIAAVVLALLGQRPKSGRLRLTDAVDPPKMAAVREANGRLAAVGACLAAAALLGSGGAAAQSMPPCAWAVEISGAQANVAFPDEAARYWVAQVPIPPGFHVEIDGQFPHARYMSFMTYDAATRAVDGIHDSEIVPEAGLVEPVHRGCRPHRLGALLCPQCRERRDSALGARAEHDLHRQRAVAEPGEVQDLARRPRCRRSSTGSTRPTRASTRWAASRCPR